MDDKAAMIRAARAWLAMGQPEMAAAAGLSLPTILRAETGGVLTDKTWRRVVTACAARGLALEDEGVIRRIGP